MNNVVEMPSRLEQIAKKVGEIVEREERDMWELGSLLCEARAICDDPMHSLVEGIEGKNPNIRFSNWKSVYRDLREIKHDKVSRAMNLHQCFGHRREEVNAWKTSALYELAKPINADVREQIIAENPEGMKVLDMRKRMKAIRTPSTSANDEPQTETTETHEPPTEGKLADFEDCLALLNTSTEDLDAAVADIMHPQYMVARGLLEHREMVQRTLGPLSKPDRKKVMNAVVLILTHEQEVFQAHLKANTTAAAKRYQAQLKEELAEQKKQSLQMRKILRTPFDKKDFKFIRGVLHSDREVSAERKEKAFDLFLKLAPLFGEKP